MKKRRIVHQEHAGANEQFLLDINPERVSPDAESASEDSSYIDDTSNSDSRESTTAQGPASLSFAEPDIDQDILPYVPANPSTYGQLDEDPVDAAPENNPTS